jgi:hypothetical protein
MKNMKKTLFIALVIISGCSKNNNNQNSQKKCYTIVFGNSIAGPACNRKSPLDTCIDPWVNVSSLKFVDKCNNDINWTVK